MTDIDRTVEESWQKSAKAAVLPYESWEHLEDETASAFSAFRVFRDFGSDRNIRKAIESIEKNEAACERRYRVWRNWASQYRWSERAADYDRYIEQLQQKEIRETIEAQGEKHREVTAKMLDVVAKKLDLMDPAELAQNNVAGWIETAVKVDREAGVSTSRNSTQKQGEFVFTPDFQEL
jgi:hypothetical protein